MEPKPILLATHRKSEPLSPVPSQYEHQFNHFEDFEIKDMIG
jgi:hypothetical protein